MKNFLISTRSRISEHSGEEFDDYIVVDGMISPDKVGEVANKIRNKIRSIIVDSQKLGENEDEVEIVLDATPLYDVIVVGLAETMTKEEKLKIILPERLCRREEEKEEAKKMEEDNA